MTSCDPCSPCVQLVATTIFGQVERKFHAIFPPSSESFVERKFHLWNFRSRERKYMGTLCTNAHLMINHHHSTKISVDLYLQFYCVICLCSSDVRFLILAIFDFLYMCVWETVPAGWWPHFARAALAGACWAYILLPAEHLCVYSGMWQVW